MYFQTTSELIEAIKPYIAEGTLAIHSETVEAVDRVTIDDAHGVGFSVSEKEIIVFWFRDHTHFEDHTSKPREGEPDYVARAKEFLSDLLQYRIRHVEVYKGKALARERCSFLYPDGRGEESFGGTWYGFLRHLNPFAKKRMETAVWQYEKDKGMFTTRQSKRSDPEAVEVIDVDEDCYIEIFYRHHAYTFVIMRLSYDEYCGYYWAPFWDSYGSFYDTKEKAIQHAMEAMKLHP